MSKTVIDRSSDRPQSADQRVRVCVRFAVREDLRFLSHHDTVRMLERAVVRAGLPVSYSEGFNPRPRMSLPLPRPLGVASEAELAWIELRAPLPAAEVAAALARVLPASCTVLGATPGGPRRRAPVAEAAEYEVELEEADVGRVAGCIRDVMDATECVVTRDMGPDKPARRIDVRPYIAALRLEGSVLTMRLNVTHGGTARPTEVLEALGLPAQKYMARTLRAHVSWDIDPDTAAETASAERKD